MQPLTANTTLVRYLLWTMGSGCALGVSHGVASSANRRELRPVAVFHDGMAGAIAGPWIPVLAPLVLAGAWPHGRCPYIFKNRK
jgi:hypothetical protein